MLYIPFDQLVSTLTAALEKAGFDTPRAARLADVFARNSLEGVYSHGVNRFPRFLGEIENGIVRLDTQPETVASLGGMEVWDGRFGPGPLIAEQAMGRAVALAARHGIACVSVRCTNHWLRPGRYGLAAADAGMAAILFTNTSGNMPAWGAVDPRLGNNPIVLAIPRKKGHILVDMAMSQFAYGKLEVAALSGKKLPIPGGFDQDGNLTDDPAAILDSHRILPTGYWKGAAMSLALDCMTAALSMGRTVSVIRRDSLPERGLSQVFIAFNFRALVDPGTVDRLLDEELDDLLGSTPAPGAEPVRYPGQNREAIARENLSRGVPVNEQTWEKIVGKN